MKKLTRIHLIIALVSFGLFSCGGDDDTPAVAVPSVSVSASVGTDPLNSGSEVEVGTEISFTATVTAPGGVNTLWINNTDYNREALGAVAGDTQGTITVSSTVPAAAEGGNLIYEFVGVDDAGRTSDTTTFTVSVVGPASPAVNAYSQVLIGGFLNSSLGSFYNAVEDTVYTYSNAVSNDEKIDFLFYYANTPMYTIAALDNTEAGITLNDQITNGSIDDFTVKNATRFKTFLSNPDFDAISNVEELTAAFSGDADVASASRVTELAVGDVFGFTLATARGSKIGLVKVVATAGASGSERAIEIEVKIQP